MKKINVNEIIKVKLTNCAKDIYYHRDDELNKEFARRGMKILEPSFPKVDEYGFSEFQIWEFMQLYGKYFVMGMSKPILEDLNFYIDEKNLEDIEL